MNESQYFFKILNLNSIGLQYQIIDFKSNGISDIENIENNKLAINIYINHLGPNIFYIRYGQNRNKYILF